MPKRDVLHRKADKVTYKSAEDGNWTISWTAEGGMTMSPEYARWFKDQYAGMTPAKKKTLLRKGSLSFPESILRVMVERGSDDPIACAELMRQALASGTVKAIARPLHENFTYPASFWRWITDQDLDGQERIMVAFERGYWDEEELSQLWRCLGRKGDLPMAGQIRFPEELADMIRIQILKQKPN